MMRQMMRRTIRKTPAAFALATLAALATFAALGGTALAQSAPPPPALKASVTVTGDVVRIGDLIDNAGPVANIAIFRSPDLGTTGAVATDRIVDAIRPHELIGIDTRGLSEVVVTRASRTIAVQDITHRVAQALSGQYGFGDAHDILVNFDREVRALQVEPDATGDLQVMSLSYDPRNTHFDITFTLASSMAIRRQITHYTGTAIATVDALAVDHAVERGQIVKASDITVLRRPKTDTTALTDTKLVVGMAARHQLQPNQPLNTADLMKPELVARNDTVTIVYQAPGITLTLRGQAQDGGALGDTISVLNLESKRVVPCVVSGPDRVNVTAITTRMVDNSVVLPQ